MTDTRELVDWPPCYNLISVWKTNFKVLNQTYVSESDILGPIDYFSDIENLVSFERAMLADYSLEIK